MAANEAAAWAEDCRSIKIFATLPGKQLYRRFGYSTTARFDVPIGDGLTLEVVRMFKAGRD